MRKFIFKLHLWVSLMVSPLILVFAVTGCFMAFEPELDHILHAKLTYIEPATKVLSIDQINQIIRKSFPVDTIVGYHLSTSKGISYQIYLNNKTVYLNQYSGQILGTMDGPDFWQKAQQTIHQLHLRLAFRDKHDTGKTIMTWAAVIMLVVLPSGLMLWWSRKRIMIRKNSQSRQFWFDVHSTIGVLSFLFIMIFVITGIVIGFENKTTPLLYAITNSKPGKIPDFKITPPANSKQISVDSALQIARNKLPGAAPFELYLPGVTDAFYIRCRYPDDLTPGGRSIVIIEPYTGKVLFAEGSHTAPGGTKLKIINRAIHTGDIFGIPSKFWGLLVCLALLVQIISGVRMWWIRKAKPSATKTNK